MTSQTKTDYEVIIVGGGASGLSAALWCDELKLRALLVESGEEFGGQLLRVYNEIKNHLGTEAKNGRDLRDRFVAQIAERAFEYRLNERAADIDTREKIVFLTNGEKLSAQFIILATGVSRRKLNIAGEDEFENKGVLESGKRDHELVKEKRAVIVGGGDAAFENALILAENAAEVTLVHRRRSFSARDEFVEPVKNNPKIKILTETVLREIAGKERVEAVKIENRQTGETEILPADAVLIRIGVEPNTRFLRGKIELDRGGYIKIDAFCETSAPGVFAVGDVANPLSPTVSTAVGMGATAVKAITNYKLRITN